MKLRNKITQEEQAIWLALIMDKASKEPQNQNLRMVLWPEEDLIRISEDKENYPRDMRQRATFYLNSAKGNHKDNTKSQRAAKINYALYQLEGIKGNASRQGYKMLMESRDIMLVADYIAMTEIARKFYAISKAAEEAAQFIRDYNFSKTGKLPASKTKMKDYYEQF